MDAAQHEALQAEAAEIPDPEGPLSEYAEMLWAWADSHPDVDRGALTIIILRQLRAHR